MKEMELWLVEPRGNRYYPVAYDDMFRTGGIQEKEWYMIERGWNCAAPRWQQESLPKGFMGRVKRMIGYFRHRAISIEG